MWLSFLWTKKRQRMVDALLLAEADFNKSKSFASKIFGVLKNVPKSEAVTFMELDGGGNICREANLSMRNLNFTGLNALDLRTTKADGSHWDFTRREDRRLARSMIDHDKPAWVVGSPPCAPFSLWNTAMNYPKATDQSYVQKMMADGRRHLRFMVSI